MTNPITSYGRTVNLDAARTQSGKSERRAGLVDVGAPASEAKASADRVDLSALAASSTPSEPAFDRAKVDSIRRAIQDGQYAIDPKRIAESFVSIERMIKD